MSNNSAVIAVVTIILLSSIVIFSGLSTPDSAQFANFCQQVDNVYMATMDRFGDLKVEHAIAGDIRTNEQIYFEVATGLDIGEYGAMSGAELTGIKGSKSTGVAKGDNCQRIDPDTARSNINMSLPYIRETNCAWYITKDGQIFNATGYIYDDKTYFNASVYKDEELPASTTNPQEKLAIKIAEAIENYEYEVQ